MATIEVDGMMCEDIRLGIMLRMEFAKNGSYGMWRKKGGGGSPSLSFSSWVVTNAGGFRRFFDEWEPDPHEQEPTP